MKCANIFSDNMVLQRNKPVRFFGTCPEDCRFVKVSVSPLSVSAEAVIKDGKWEAVLPPMPACDCCLVQVMSGNRCHFFNNVAIGEVWLAGGQSNMEYELQNEKNGKEELEVCEKENVRFYYTPKTAMVDDELFRAEERASWQTASAKNSGNWSAVGYYFAKELSRKLGCTVGVIGCNWGGTSASAWIPREAIETKESLLPYLEAYDKATAGKTDEEMIREYREYQEYDRQWFIRSQEVYAEKPDAEWEEVCAICGENRYPGPINIANPMRPCGLYDTMVSRVCPYTLKGVLWYQGESDDHRPDTYGDLLTALIGCWREKWHDGSMPFMVVQLPMHRYKNDADNGSWAKIRQAQREVSEQLKNVGLAVAIDCGEFNNIHPIEKRRVAHRLYIAALEKTYGIDCPGEHYPELTGCNKTDGKLVLKFSRNLIPAEKPEGFMLRIGGENVPAYPEISGNTAVFDVDPDSVSEVSYLWTNYCRVDLFGENGLPVPPVRRLLGD